MNRKQFIAYLGTGSLAALLGGCKGFLDQASNKGNISRSNYFKSLKEAKTSVEATYRFIDYTSWWQTAAFRYWLNEAASDNAWNGATRGAHPRYISITHYTLNANNTQVLGPWVMYYKTIGRTNNEIVGVKSAPISNNNKTQLIAELKFIRAYCYFELIRMFGGVPIVLKIHSPSTHIPRSTVEDSYKQVIKDLNAGVSALPQNRSILLLIDLEPARERHLLY